MSMNDDAMDAMKTPDANQKVLDRFSHLHSLALNAIDNLKLTNKKMFLNNANQIGKPGAEGSGAYGTQIDRRVKSAIRGQRAPGMHARAPAQAQRLKLRNLYNSQSQDESDT